MKKDLLHDTLVSEFGVTKISKKALDAILSQLAETVLLRIGTDVLIKLKPEEREKLEKLQQENKEDEADTYIRSCLPNYDEFVFNIIRDEVLETKKIVVDTFGEL